MSRPFPYPKRPAHPLDEAARVVALHAANPGRADAFNAWAARLDRIAWRAIGCSVWDLARADEGDAMCAFLRGEHCAAYLRRVLA